MALPPAELDTEEEWQIVSPDWWHTELHSVSWSYGDPNSSASKCYAKPPHYHESLSRSLFIGAEVLSPDASTPANRLDADAIPISRQADMLNPDLVGVRIAREAVTAYEIDVGIHSQDVLAFGSDGHFKKAASDLHTKISEDEVAFSKERWDELVHGLIGRLHLTPSPQSEQFMVGGDESHDALSVCAFSPVSSTGLHRSTSTLSSTDLTDSDRSVNSVSMPSTPKAKTSYADIVVKNVSPSSTGGGVHHLPETSPSRPLNASASSFVPSFSTPAKPDHIPIPFFHLPSEPSRSAALSSPSPTLTNFTFPSLNDPFDMHVPPLPSITIKKDEQGFYDISPPPSYAQSQRPSSALLPPFLQGPPHRRKALTSKTRAIVDSLKTSSQSQGGVVGLGTVGLGLEAGIRSKSASQSPSPSPMFYDHDFFKPRLSVSEDGGDRDSCLSSPSAENGGDGWIGMNDVGSTTEVKTKAKRAQDLFSVLARHRKNLTPSNEKEGSLGFEAAQEDAVVEVSLPSLPPSPALSSNDGWIEGSLSLPPSHPHAQAQTQSHSVKECCFSNPPAQSRRPASSSTTYPVTYPSVPVLSTPQFPNVTLTPYFYPSYPHMSYAAYMQMQMQLHLHNMQIRNPPVSPGAGAVGEWFLYPAENTPPRWVASPALHAATHAGAAVSMTD